ncbi:MAG: hypothetical protein EOP04_24460 [Proteobacteria bacterium]|nr:MAG: hypothetical protein EOP04_24460 [Pseudomonadota bacterium]
MEHHILIFLAKYLIVDSSTTEEPAFPSVQEICMYTKISPTVLKKRLKSLSVKGFLLVEEVKFRTPGVRFLHTHFNYSLTPMAEGYFRENEKPVIVPKEKPEEEPEEKPFYGPPYIPQIICEEPVVEVSTASADRVLKAWESEFSAKVSSDEIEKFYKAYERENQPEEYYFHNIHLISRDPLLSKNIWTPNFLFSQLGRKTIERFSTERCESEDPAVVEELPPVEPVTLKTEHEETDQSIEKSITNCNLIKDHEDLTAEIVRLLKLNSGEDYQRILRSNLLALRVYKFDRSLSIFERSLRGLNVPHIASQRLDS